MNTLEVFKGHKEKQEGYSLENQGEGDRRGEQRSQPCRPQDGMQF